MLAMCIDCCEMSQCQQLEWRCVLYHKHPTSARTRFLRVGRDAVLPLPVDDDCVLAMPDPDRRVSQHPATGLSLVAREIGVGVGSLRVESAPLAHIDGEAAPVWLVRVMGIDPPDEGVLPVDGRFVSILETRDIPMPQQKLLRLAYERVLG